VTRQRKSPPIAKPNYWQGSGPWFPRADAASLKRAFRQQARRWHPISMAKRDPVAEERFKWVNEAYAVLGDPKRRAALEAGLDPAGRPQRRH